MIKRTTDKVALVLSFALLLGPYATLASPNDREEKSPRPPTRALTRPAKSAPAARARKFAPAARVQISGLLPGQTQTLLPDGRTLLIGGEGADGPRAAVAVSDGRTGAPAQLANGLRHARAWHSSTMLPDGLVLVYGGVGPQGRPQGGAEIFDPVTQKSEQLAPAGLGPRAYHSATLLTDGRTLIVGGTTEKGQPGGAMLWDYRTRKLSALPSAPALVRRKHAATLLADGNVLFEGGVDGDGNEVAAAELYHSASQTFGPTNLSSAPDQSAPYLAASLPADGARDVPADGVVALRFSKPVRAESLGSDTVTLEGSEGKVIARVVPAEGGRLAFVTPRQPLLAGMTYTVSASGPLDETNQPLTPASFSFTTEAERGAGDRTPEADDWTPDERNYHGEWKSKTKDSPWRALPPLKAADGVTALAGQALTLDGKPLADVTMFVGALSARTDATGRFLLPQLAAGHHVLRIDGRTASRNKKVYGIFRVGVALVAGKTTALPYTIWMPKLDTANAVRIASPTTAPTVVKNPRIPGMELRLPPNTVVRDVDGRAVTEVSITPIPTNQPPFPLPPNVDVPVYFTIQPGGSQVIPPRAQLVYPNFIGSRPGTRVDFYNYDPTGKGWYVYGQGTVTPDGRQIMPDPGVTLYEFSGAMIASPSMAPTTWIPYGAGNPGGFGVDLGSGLFVHEETDMSLPGLGGIALSRTYRPGDTISRSFGIGASHLFDVFLVGSTFPYTYMSMIMPDGGQIYFGRISAGTGYDDAVFEHTGTSSCFLGSQISWNGNGWNLSLRNGSTYVFPEAFGVSRPMQSALVGFTDRFGNVFSLTRNSAGDLTRISSPSGRWIDLTYDTGHRITQAQDNIGRTVGYSYDTTGRLASVTNPLSGIRAYTYDSSNRMLDITDARGKTFPLNEYDSNGRVIKQTLADETPSTLTDNPTYQFAYTVDSAGRVTQTDVTDPSGGVRRTTFNAAGYTLTETQALGSADEQTITFEREATTNRLISVTDDGGRKTAYEHDSLGRLSEVTSLDGTPEALSTQYTYSQSCSCDAVATITDPLNRTISYDYNSAGNVTSVTDPLNHTTTYAYNSAGQQVSITDPLNQTTQYVYENGDLVGVTDPSGQTATAFLDNAGRLRSLKTPLGKAFRYEYDAMNRPVKATDAAGGINEFTYDANGNLLTVKDARNNVTSFTYDSMNRLTSRTDPLSRTDTYEYDALGKVKKFTDRRGKVMTITYDARGRATFVGYGTTVSGGVTSYESSISYEFDSAGRLAEVTDSAAGTITYAFDNFDRMTSKTTPHGTISYTYDTAGRRTSMTVSGQATIYYTYDHADRVTQISKGLTTVGFTYDNGDRLASVTWANGIVIEYTHDQNSNLTAITYKQGSTVLGDLTYEYDAHGRRTKMGGSFARVGLPQAMTSATYDAGNQMTQRDGVSLTYDNSGNLTSDGSNTYTWNARSQLSSLSGPSLSATFQYDGVGNRTGKTVNSTATNYLYDVADVVQELSGTTPIANVLSGGVDNVLSRTDAAGTRTPFTDVLGSTLALVDDSGTVQTEYTYDAFGNTSATGSASGNSAKFTGRDDDGTGLYYYRARYYSPKLQRFISQDPIGYAGGDLNLYAYVRNDPVNYQDPRGLWPTREFAGVGGPVHQDSARRVLGNSLSAEHMGWLVQALYDADNSEWQTVEMSHRHAMTPRYENRRVARRKANEFVRGNLVAAQNAARRNDWKEAMTRLGFAMHAMQDATSPAHANFRVYHGGTIELLAHINEENFDPGAGSNLDNATKLAYLYFLGNVPMPSDFFSNLCTDVYRAP